MAFQDRRAEVERFQRLIRPDSRQWLLAFYGLPGVGRSALLRHLRDGLSPEWVAADLNFGLSTFRTEASAVLQSLSTPFETRVPPAVWTAYKSQATEIERAIHVNVQAEQHAQDHASIVDSPQTIHVHLGQVLVEAARARASAWIRLASESGCPVCLFLDGWDDLRDRAQEEIRAWVIEALLWQGHAALPMLRVVASSDRSLRSEEQGLQPIPVLETDDVELGPLTEAEAISLSAELGLEDPAARQALFRWSGGYPGLIELAVAVCRSHPEREREELTRDFTREAGLDWFLRKLVASLEDEDSKKVLERGVVLRHWVLETLGRVCECEDLDLAWYAQFVENPFVLDADGLPGYKRFADLVRGVQLPQLWQQQPGLYRALHGRALAWYLELGARAGPSRRWGP